MTLPLAGIPWIPALAILLTLALVLLWRRPHRTPLYEALWPLVGILAGVAAGAAALRAEARDCRLHLPVRAEGEVVGRFLGRVEAGRALPFRVESGLPGGCRGTVQALWPRGVPLPPTGARIQGRAEWEGRGFPESGRGESAGRLRFRAEGSGPSGGGLFETGVRGGLLRIRGATLDRMALLWPERAPTVEALVVARREHLDPELRSAFARSGTAHLLAISGFHVGVVAGLLLGLLRSLGLPPPRAALGSAFGSWLYVLGIGAPDAAMRAAVLLTTLAFSRIRGRPAVSIGALSTAFLVLLLLDPLALRSVGFQLSFAGTFGLVAFRHPLERGADALWIRLGRRPPRRGPGAGAGERWLTGASEGGVAGVAATLPTLPLLAWHFDQISLVGIPTTLAIAPWISLCIPAIAVTLGWSGMGIPGAEFLAGGVDTLLWGVEQGVRRVAELPGAVIWVSRPALVGGLLGGGMTALFLRRRLLPTTRPRVRWGVVALATAAGGVGSPLARAIPEGLLLVSPELEVHFIDVGQGDATALRLPRGGGWIVIDAGPRGPRWDAGARRVVPHLHREGVRRIEFLVLTHPHLDHIGGADALLNAFPIRGVLDPSKPLPSGAYVELQRRAAEQNVPWVPARAGQVFERSGVEIRVLHPRHPEEESETNNLSVVLLLRFGAATLLLTGDAHGEVETVLEEELSSVTVLKVGHHGSRTSSSSAFLDVVRPEWALIGVGDGNRYGHPHSEVLRRLEALGTRVLRTDRDGSIRLRIRSDGTVKVRTDRPLRGEGFLRERPAG